jgi:hypothetical protein
MYILFLRGDKMYSANLFTENSEDLKKFLKLFYDKDINLENNLKFEINFENPVDMIELISTLTDNNEKYNIGLWISIDSNIYINITELNLDKIIKYILERYPN